MVLPVVASFTTKRWRQNEIWSGKSMPAPAWSCPNCLELSSEKDRLWKGCHKKVEWEDVFSSNPKWCDPYPSIYHGHRRRRKKIDFQYMATIDFPSAKNMFSSDNLVRFDTLQCIQKNNRFSSAGFIGTKKSFHRIQASKNAVFGDLSEDLVLVIADFGRFPFLGDTVPWVPWTVERESKNVASYKPTYTYI